MAGVIVVMLILAIIIPAMVMFVQNEAKWSMKQTQNMTAFQIAEAAVDRGVRKISESTTTWENAMQGTFPADYEFNRSFTDLTGGCYAISITSGPDSDQVTIITVSTQSKKFERRSVQAIFQNAPMGDIAVSGRSGISISGSQTQIEWGAIVTPKNVTMNGRQSPQVWTSGSVDLDSNGSTPPNCDSPNCVGWHSYEPNIPPDPELDTQAFYDAAVASGTLFNGNQCWGTGAAECGVSCAVQCGNDTSCATGKTYYVNGDLCIKQNMYVQGTLFVAGNMNLPNGIAGAKNNLEVNLPRKAWQQYGLAYSSYTAFTIGCGGATNNDPVDSTAPAAFPGLASGYKSPATARKCIDSVAVNGFLYVSGNLSQSGGAGQTSIVGAAYVGGTVTVTANTFTVWYAEYAGDYIKSTNVILSRISWKDLPDRLYPGGLACNN